MTKIFKSVSFDIATHSVFNFLGESDERVMGGAVFSAGDWVPDPVPVLVTEKVNPDGCEDRLRFNLPLR